MKTTPQCSSSPVGLNSGLTTSRRRFVRQCVGAAAAGIAGWHSLARAGTPSNPTEKAVFNLYQSLTSEQRKETCFDWDHRVNIKYGRVPLHVPDPKGVLLRTHVSNAWRITPQFLNGPFYTDEQRELVAAVMDAVLAPGWTQKLVRQGEEDSGKPWGGDQGVAIFGTPGSGRCQCVVTGFHLTLRANCDPGAQSAFGGGITHGHQPSGFYEEVGHPDNLFWPQAVRANEVFQLLDDAQRKQSIVDHDIPFFTTDGKLGDKPEKRIDRSNVVADSPRNRPREPDIRFRPSPADIPGLSIARMGRDQKAAVERTLESLLEPYQQSSRDQVHDCLRKQGGVDRCNLIFFSEHDLGNDGQWDNWRLEGPSFVWYFRGSPHVHIWIHVADNPNAPISSYFG